jgi:hypothetical protein
VRFYGTSIHIVPENISLPPPATPAQSLLSNPSVNSTK